MGKEIKTIAFGTPDDNMCVNCERPHQYCICDADDDKSDEEENEIKQTKED